MLDLIADSNLVTEPNITQIQLVDLWHFVVLNCAPIAIGEADVNLSFECHIIPVPFLIGELRETWRRSVVLTGI
jgi:hypothetical protein